MSSSTDEIAEPTDINVLREEWQALLDDPYVTFHMTGEALATMVRGLAVNLLIFTKDLITGNSDDLRQLSSLQLRERLIENMHNGQEIIDEMGRRALEEAGINVVMDDVEEGRVSGDASEAADAVSHEEVD